MKVNRDPLDLIRIAAPCGSNWNDMYGDSRRRFCKECSLNVYNISDMTRDEAKRFLIASEGRVCLRIYRRTDGTVITRDCPVGLARVRRAASRIATAAFAVIAGFFGGIATFQIYRDICNLIDMGESVTATSTDHDGVSFGITDGILTNLGEVRERLLNGDK